MLLEKDLLCEIHSSFRRLRLKETSSEESNVQFESTLIFPVFRGANLSIK